MAPPYPPDRLPSRPPLATPDRSAADAMWAHYLAAGHHALSGDAHPVEQLGDSAESAEELLALVVHRIKRATAMSMASILHAGAVPPQIGGHWLVADSHGAPRVVLRSIELRVGRLDSVDDTFAHDEGEDDRSRASWLDGHRRYFGRECARIGVPFDDGIEVVFERFRVVWPPALSD